MRDAKGGGWGGGHHDGSQDGRGAHVCEVFVAGYMGEKVIIMMMMG